jgi:hypothetical protein
MNDIAMKINDVLIIGNDSKMTMIKITSFTKTVSRQKTIHLTSVLFFALLPVTTYAVDAELVARDLFLTLDSEPTGFSYTATGPTGTRSGDDAFDSGFGLSLGVRWSFTPTGSAIGLIAGADLGATNYRYQEGANNLTTGARVVLGVGWAISDSWEVLLEPTFEYGYASFNFPSTTSYPTVKVTGSYLGYGIRANTIWHLSDQWALMGAVGWKQINDDLSGDGVDLELVQSGPSVSFGILYRFSAAPTRIE